MGRRGAAGMCSVHACVCQSPEDRRWAEQRLQGPFFADMKKTHVRGTRCFLGLEFGKG